MQDCLILSVQLILVLVKCFDELVHGFDRGYAVVDAGLLDKCVFGVVVSQLNQAGILPIVLADCLEGMEAELAPLAQQG